MNLSFKNVLCVCCLLLSGSVYAQVPQDLIDKAKAAGMSDTQIQQELAKRMKQEGGSVGSQATATDAKVSDRVMPVIDEGQSLEAQRRNNLPASAMENTVFGHEIFSNKNLSFAPDLNIPTPKDYVLSAGDELLINVWGDSELNLKLKISPDGTILVPNLGPVSVSGLTIAGAETRLRQELSQIMSTLSGS